MGNIMTGLWTAVSGLTVSQNAINTTAHNLTNIDTKGSTRQQVVITDFRYNNIGHSTYSTWQSGLGATTQVVRQVRNEFYDAKFRTESGRLSFYETQRQAVNEVEDIMGELENSPFQESIKKLWANIQELVKAPDDKTARASLAKNAEAFTQRAEIIMKQLNEYQVNMNTQISDKVLKINELGANIAKMNLEITKVEGNLVERANDYRDMRNNYLDELSKLIDIKVTEEADGSVTVMAENTQLVTSNTSYTMRTEKMSDGSNMLKPVWNHINQDVYDMSRLPDYNAGTNIGSLKGLLWARGGDRADYTDVPVKPDVKDYTGTTDPAYVTAMNNYNTAVEKYNLEVDSSVIRTVQSQLDTLIHGIVTAVNDILCPNVEVNIAGVGNIKVLSPTAPMGMDDNSTTGTELFSRKSVDRYDTSTPIYIRARKDALGNLIKDADGNQLYESCLATDDGAVKTYKYNEEDPAERNSLYSIGELTVNKDLLANYALLPLSASGGTGDFAYNGVAKKLADVWNQPFSALSPNVTKKNTFNEYYIAMWGDLGTKGEKYNSSAEDQAVMVNNIENSRQNVMGISSDEELSNLIKYQHAYNASARYFNVVDSMLEHLVTRL